MGSVTCLLHTGLTMMLSKAPTGYCLNYTALLCQLSCLDCSHEKPAVYGEITKRTLIPGTPVSAHAYGALPMNPLHSSDTRALF